MNVTVFMNVRCVRTVSTALRVTERININWLSQSDFGTISEQSRVCLRDVFHQLNDTLEFSFLTTVLIFEYHLNKVNLVNYTRS